MRMLKVATMVVAAALTLFPQPKAAQAGTIKVKPASWSELFVPILHGRPGS